MKRLVLMIMLCVPIIGMAQNTWEMPEKSAQGKQNVDAKYLVGAVPEVDGKVAFKKTIEAKGKSAKDIFEIIDSYMRKMAKESNQTEQSRVTLSDSTEHKLVGMYQEWLVFKSTPLVLDQTRFYYILAVDCFDGKAEVTLTNIYYLYEEERAPQRFAAEEWITDKWGLTKNKNKLSRVSGKFRRKTIDRKDYLFNKIESLLK